MGPQFKVSSERLGSLGLNPLALVYTESRVTTTPRRILLCNDIHNKVAFTDGAIMHYSAKIIIKMQFYVEFCIHALGLLNLFNTFQKKEDARPSLTSYCFFLNSFNIFSNT